VRINNIFYAVTLSLTANLITIVIAGFLLRIHNPSHAQNKDMEDYKEIEDEVELLQWQSRVAKIRQYVAENMASDLRVATICQKLDMNQYTLQHIFKEQQQETYHKYVERIRMNKALQLLKQGKWVKEVMPATGYHNWSTFEKAFKRRFKYAPVFFKK
jgi:AraC-like DNA-binding protein